MNLISFIQTVGYLGIFGIIFIETGVLVGFFFPGDTLLFSVGVLSYEHYFNLPFAIIVLVLASIAGGMFGYWTGGKLGPKIFTRDDSPFFKKSHVAKAEKFFHTHGSITVFIARYVPVIRTFIPTIAGVARMNYRKFFVYNLLGGIAWCTSIVLIGYFLGQKIPNIDKYLLPIVGIACAASCIPILIEVFKKKHKTR